MFWKKKRGTDKLLFQNYVPLRLSINIPTILERKAKKRNYSEIYADFRQSLANETFTIACMIGTCRSDISTGIFAQNDKNYEQLMKVIRDGLTKIIAVIEQKGEINLTKLASSFMNAEMDTLPKYGLSKDLTIEEIKSLGGIFLFGYTFGHDHPQRFLEMLKKRFQEPDTIGLNTFFIVGLLAIYGSVIEEDDRCFLLNTNELRLAYENGTLPQKWVNIYQNIASKLVRDYELTVGFPK